MQRSNGLRWGAGSHDNRRLGPELCLAHARRINSSGVRRQNRDGRRQVRLPHQIKQKCRKLRTKVKPDRQGSWMVQYPLTPNQQDAIPGCERPYIFTAIYID